MYGMPGQALDWERVDQFFYFSAFSAPSAVNCYKLTNLLSCKKSELRFPHEICL